MWPTIRDEKPEKFLPLGTLYETQPLLASQARGTGQEKTRKRGVMFRGIMWKSASNFKPSMNLCAVGEHRNDWEIWAKFRDERLRTTSKCPSTSQEAGTNGRSGQAGGTGHARSRSMSPGRPWKFV